MTTSTTPVTPYLERFLARSMPPLSSDLEEIFTSGDEFGKKEMQVSRLQAAFIDMLVKISNAKNIFEVGTYVGFSASVFAKASPQIESVVTCEIVPEFHKKAISNLEIHGLDGVVRPLLGDAKSIVSNLGVSDRKFDIFFLDGDKENYASYVDAAASILSCGGLFIVDNTLFKGEVVGGESQYSLGIRSLIERMGDHRMFDFCHVTIGDGMLVARRR